MRAKELNGNLFAVCASGLQGRRLLEELLAGLGPRASSRRRVEGFEVSWEFVLSFWSTPSLFGSSEVLVVEGAHALGRMPEEVASDFERLRPGGNPVVLVSERPLSSYAGPLASGLFVELEGGALEEPPWWRFPEEVEARFRSRGVEVSPGALELLCLGYESWGELESEVRKLLLACELLGLSRVDEELVLDLCPLGAGRALWCSLEGVLRGDLGLFLRRWDELRLSSDPMELLNQIYSRVRPLYHFARLGEEEVLEKLCSGKLHARQVREASRARGALERARGLLLSLALLSARYKMGLSFDPRELELALLRALGVGAGQIIK